MQTQQHEGQEQLPAIAREFQEAGNPLKMNGQGFKCGHEPVHSSNSGTCTSINVDKEAWYCHSCRQGGGIIDAVKSLKRYTHRQAVDYLVAKYGNRNFNYSDERQEAPRPLQRVLSKPEPFPLDALGALGAPALRLHAVIKAPLAICGQSVLAATTLAVQAYRDAVNDGRVIPLSQYFLTIAESGERKSAVDTEALRAHKAHEKRLHEQYEPLLLDYENDLAAFKKSRDEALKRAKTRADRKKALDDLGPPPTAPLHPMFVCEEPSYPGLIKQYLRGRPSLGLFADEGGHPYCKV
jgi:hypothetical protein